jgi:hypothetical protein
VVEHPQEPVKRTGSATMWTADPSTDVGGDGSLQGDRPGFNAATEP